MPKCTQSGTDEEKVYSRRGRLTEQSDFRSLRCAMVMPDAQMHTVLAANGVADHPALRRAPKRSPGLSSENAAF